MGAKVAAQSLPLQSVLWLFPCRHHCCRLRLSQPLWDIVIRREIDPLMARSHCLTTVFLGSSLMPLRTYVVSIGKSVTSDNS